METLLDWERFQHYYNCTFYDYNSIPVENRKNFWVGISLLILYGIFELLYLPCLGVFMRKDNRRESCYKLMLFMGILSMVNIHSSGLIIGIYAIRGDVFCNRPLFNYVIGMPAFGLYSSESLVTIMLALNRCVEMWDHQVASMLFDHGRVYLWMSTALVYGLYLGLFTSPPMPNGMLVGWFWNPHIAYALDTEEVYVNSHFSAHNIGIGFGIPLIYALFWIMMRRKMRLVSIGNQQRKYADKGSRTRNANMFMQVLLIGLFHLIYTLLYVFMQYVPVPPWVVMVASFAWLMAQGVVPVIYIIFNKYIRRSIVHSFIRPAITHISRGGFSNSQRNRFVNSTASSAATSKPNDKCNNINIISKSEVTAKY